MLRKMFASISLIFFSSLAFSQTTTTPMPPIAAKKPKTFENFGDKRVDDYFWLREKSAPDVIDYLKAENVYTDAFMKPHAAFRDTLYKDMLSRID